MQPVLQPERDVQWHVLVGIAVNKANWRVDGDGRFEKTHGLSRLPEGECRQLGLRAIGVRLLQLAVTPERGLFGVRVAPFGEVGGGRDSDQRRNAIRTAK